MGDGTATEVYLPIEDEHVPEAALVVRVKGDPAVALPAIVTAARAVDPRVMPTIGLLRDAFEQRLETPKQMAAVVSAIGMLALSVAAIGLAGLLSFSVSQRVREIGIRMALGARSRDVVQSVLRQFVWPVACGLGGGLLAAALLSAVLKRELFGLSHLDPVSYAAATLLFAVVAFLSAVGPLRRAVRVNPITALRYE
jgi:ABC-type antimicrobial peptide transport system permease subunit